MRAKISPIPDEYISNNIVARTIGYYRFFMTTLFMLGSKLRNGVYFHKKTTLHKILDGTYFSDKYFDTFYFSGSSYITYCTNPEISKEVLKYHRCDKDSIYGMNRSFESFLDIVREIFPNDTIHDNDFIMTCDEEHTKFYHGVLHKSLFGNKERNTQIIHDNIIKYFDVEDGTKLPARDIVEKYVCDNFTEILFDGTFLSDECNFVKCSNQFNKYIYNKVFHSSAINENAKDMVHKAILDIGILVDKIMSNNPNLFPGLSVVHIKVMIVMLLFAGQETTTTLLMYVLFEISKDRDSSPNEILYKSLRNTTPAYAIGSRLRSNVVIEIYDDNDNIIQKKYISKNNGIGAYPLVMAMNASPMGVNYEGFFPFRKGIHRCIGEMLVKDEVKMLVEYLRENYTLETDTNKLYIEQALTQKIKGDFLITFAKK
jgi:hypothetical protein